MSTAASRTGLLAVVMPLGFDIYFGAILAGVTDAAYEQGLRVSIASTRHEHAREVQLLAQLSDTTDGALVILPEQSGDELKRAVSDDYPVVVIDPLVPLGGAVPSVAAENRRGALDGLGIPVEPALFVEADWEIGPGADAAAQLLELDDPPTAIFGFNDAI